METGEVEVGEGEGSVDELGDADGDGEDESDSDTSGESIESVEVGESADVALAAGCAAGLVHALSGTAKAMIAVMSRLRRRTSPP